MQQTRSLDVDLELIQWRTLRGAFLGVSVCLFVRMECVCFAMLLYTNLR
jgi:hypothetical protein